MVLARVVAAAGNSPWEGKRELKLLSITWELVIAVPVSAVLLQESCGVYKQRFGSNGFLDRI